SVRQPAGAGGHPRSRRTAGCRVGHRGPGQGGRGLRQQDRVLGVGPPELDSRGRGHRRWPAGGPGLAHRVPQAGDGYGPADRLGGRARREGRREGGQGPEGSEGDVMDLDDVMDDAAGMIAPDDTGGVTPDLDELQQDEPTVPALDVDVIGPVRTHALPARTCVMHNVTVGATATQILGRDLRRGRVLLWAYADAAALYYVGTRDDEVTSGTSAKLVAAPNDGSAVPQVLELRHCEAVYVRAASGTVDVQYVAEQWAD